MAAVGRSWASHSGDNALAPRVPHSLHRPDHCPGRACGPRTGSAPAQRGPRVRSRLAWDLLSAYLLCQAIAWNHGRLMMGVWESARLRAATSALFYNLQENVDSDEWVPRNIGFARRA